MGLFRVRKIVVNEPQLDSDTIKLLGKFSGLRELEITSTDEALLAHLRKALPDATVLALPIAVPAEEEWPAKQPDA